MTGFQSGLDADALRQRLESLADALPALVAFVDADQVYRYVNATYAKWFGRDRDAFVGRRLDEVAEPEAYERIRPHVEQVLGGTPQQFRGAVSYPSGQRNVQVHYSPVRDARGAVTGFAVLVYDVTHERKLEATERERFESQRLAAHRLGRLLEVAGQLAVAGSEDEVARAVVDSGPDAIGASAAGAWLLAADGDALVLTRSHGFVAQQTTNFAKIALDAANPVSEAVRTGQPVWVSSRAEYGARYPAEEATQPGPLASGVLPIVVGGDTRGALAFEFHDERRLTVVERTYMEVLAAHAGHALQRVWLHFELREALETRQAMIQSSPAAIMLLDADGVVQSWNAAAEQMFGWSADEVIGRFLPTISREQRAGFLTMLARVLAGNVITGFETTRRTRSGAIVDVAIHAAPVRRSSGAVWIGLLDIGLPVMNGYELARRLRADPRHAGMRLIAVTGYGREGDRARSQAAGFDSHLAKPVSLEDLQRAVED